MKGNIHALCTNLEKRINKISPPDTRVASLVSLDAMSESSFQ